MEISQILKLISQTRSRYRRLKKISQTVEDIADYIVGT